jgi:hypothetical protein
MAYYSIFPEKDTTIYSHPDREKLNTGHDEIIEIVKERGTLNSDRYYPSRILIKFPTADIQDVFTNKVNTTNFWSASLELFTTEHKNLTTTLNLDVYPLSHSFNEGSGRYTNIPTGSNGASWIYRDNDITQTKWATGSSALTGLTYGSSSIYINEFPSGSAMELTINGVDFVPVVSASLFDSNNNEVFVEISNSIDGFGTNLATAINASSSITLVSASWMAVSDGSVLILSGSELGSDHNVTITTSSVTGNTQPVFTSSVSNYSIQGGTSTTTSGWAQGTTGSINSDLIEHGGGTWYTGSDFYATQQFLVGNNLDTNFNVTDIVKKYSSSIFLSSTYPTGIPNNGFLIKQPESVEINISSSFGEMMYFSSNTHTIYIPKLTFRWDDSSYIPTAGATTLNSGDIFLELHNNKARFQRKSKQRFRLTTRKRYPDRTFTTSSNYLDIQYLPSSSYYSLRDADTDEVVIPFDTECTKLSADGDGMYFDLYMEGLQPERYYKLMFRTDNNDGIQIFDKDYFFKIVR